MNSRRKFLKITGAGITASLLNPLSSQASKVKTKGESIKIGVLLPQSNEHPKYPGSFLNGLQLGLNQHNAVQKNKIEIISEQVNFGTPLITKEKVQKLITENSVSLITGILNPEVVAHIGEMLKNAETPALIANAGENYLVKDLKENNYLFFNSLSLFQAAYESGKYAVNNFGKNVAIVTSFYDSGYDSLFTFRLGAEKQGGTICETFLAKQDDQEFNSQTIDKIKKLNPDCIYVFLNGKKSDDFIRNLYINKVNIPIITSAFSTEESRLVNLGEAARNVVSLSTWSKNLKTKENKLYQEAFTKKYNKEADMFSVLGYETGQILYETLSRCSYNFSGKNIAKNIKTCQIESPRGKVAFNSNSGMATSKLYICKSRLNPFSIPENVVINEISPVSEFDEQFSVLDNSIHSGWLNPYLFV